MQTNTCDFDATRPVAIQLRGPDGAKTTRVDAGPEFKLSASDGLYELNLPYPTRKISRTCWKAFNSQACPYATAGALDLVHFPDAAANSCDKNYETPNGCLAHGMKKYYGG